MLCRVFSKFLRGIFDWKSACDFNFFILSSLCIPVGDEELAPVGWLCCVHLRDFWLSQCLSPFRNVNGYQQREWRGGGWGSNLQWTSIPSREVYISSCSFMLQKPGGFVKISHMWLVSFTWLVAMTSKVVSQTLQRNQQSLLPFNWTLF